MTHYRDRLEAGEFAPTENGEGEGVAPRTHAELDQLAAERGHTWSAEGLTVAQKRVELGV